MPTYEVIVTETRRVRMQVPAPNEAEAKRRAIAIEDEDEPKISILMSRCLRRSSAWSRRRRASSDWNGAGRGHAPPPRPLTQRREADADPMNGRLRYALSVALLLAATTARAACVDAEAWQASIGPRTVTCCGRHGLHALGRADDIDDVTRWCPRVARRSLTIHAFINWDVTPNVPFRARRVERRLSRRPALPPPTAQAVLARPAAVLRHRRGAGHRGLRADRRQRPYVFHRADHQRGGGDPLRPANHPVDALDGGDEAMSRSIEIAR